jgi:hypothetical protein
MKPPKNIKSGFALLDVKSGRQGLYKYFGGDNWSRINKRPKPIKVKIEGYITDIWGNDDGVSREFEIEVKKVTIK